MTATLLALLTLLAPDSDLVAHYTFASLNAGVVRDESGQGHDLRVQGTANLVAGPARQALALDGKSFLRAEKIDGLELGDTFTLELRVRFDQHPDSGSRLLDRQTIGGNDGFMLDTWPKGHLRLISQPAFLRADQDLPLGQWLHLAAVVSGADGEARLYLNGEEIASGGAGGKCKASPHPLTVGANSTGGDQLRGALDEVRIYRRALSADEIAAHAAGKEIAPPSAPGATPLPVMVSADAPLVDEEALCWASDLVYRQPARYPFEAMHLGNGRLGVTLWNQDGLRCQLQPGDYRLGIEPVSAGRVTIRSAALADPKPARFEQRLNLWDGLVSLDAATTAGKVSATCFVSEDYRDTLVCRIHDESPGPREVLLEQWRPTAKLAHGANWIGVAEHSNHAEHFLADGFGLLIRSDAAATSEARGEKSLVLKLPDGLRDYTLYLTCPAVRWPAETTLELVHSASEDAVATGWERLLQEHKRPWHDLWQRSFLHLVGPNGEGLVLEQAYRLFLYDMACQSRNTLLPPKFNGGNFLVEQDLRHWGGGYWHQNTRELFWPLYAAGLTPLSDSYFALYTRNLANAAERAKVTYGAAGLHVAEWTTPDGTSGVPKPPLTPGYQAHLVTVGLEVALQGWWRYQYSGDEAFLQKTVYPLLRGGIEFYRAYAKREADGKWHLENANAQETYWAVRDPHQDLAALRWAIPTALTVSAKLGQDAELRPQWEAFLADLAPYPLDDAKHILRAADLKPTDEVHNSENVELYGIYPFGQFGLGLPDYELAKRTFENRFVQSMGNGWEPAAIVAARLGLADQAAALTLAHLRNNLRGNNGTWYSPTTAVFVDNLPDSPYYDAPGVSAMALQEMLLQSHTGTIVLAPACPARWQAQFRLWARGGFRVTCETQAGKPRYALLESTRGGTCRLANPWDEAIVTLKGQAVLRGKARVLSFDTVQGGVYRVENAAEPLATMVHEPLSPTRNDGVHFLGRKLPAWPAWDNLTLLGIDADGHTPQRARLARRAREAEEALAKATVGLTRLVTTPPEGVTVANGKSVTLDLGAPKPVSAVTFSRDKSGLRVDDAAVGYAWELSTDGTAWTTLVDHAKQRAAPAGQADRFEARTGRYVRLTVSGEYGGEVRVEEAGVWGM